MTPEEVKQVSACALSDGRSHDPAVVAHALTLGGRAAEHGCAIPCAVLLDLVALVSRPKAPQRHLPDSMQGVHAARVRRYDEWIRNYAERVSQTLFGTAGLNRRRVPDLLPFLIELWAGRPPSSNDRNAVLQAAIVYRALTQQTDSVFKAWSDPRPTDPRAWRWAEAIGEHPRPNLAPRATVTWSWAALSEGDETPLHERFDHRAAHLYFDAPDLEPSEEQRRRLRRLRVHEERMSRPFSESIEEQDPFFGSVSLGTLALGEYGEYLLANGSHTKLSNPRDRVAPRDTHVHLCWMLSYPGVRAPFAASALAGLAAVVLDDLRDALKGIPTRFHLHGDGAAGDHTTDAGRSGARYKSGESGAPPANVLRTLFRRPLLSRAVRAHGWPAPHAARRERQHLWIGFILEPDLHRLAETTIDRQPPEESVIGLAERARPAIKRELDLVFVLRPGPSSTSQATGLGVRLWGGRLIRNEPIHDLQIPFVPDDAWLRSARARLIDCVVDVLEERGRG